MKENSIILHIPHSSVSVPRDVRNTFKLSSRELKEEIIQLSDLHTESLFANKIEHSISVVFPVSRVVVDPERFSDDEDEPMSRYGMGAVYTHTVDGNILRDNLTQKERNRLMKKYYFPHHNLLTNAVARAINDYGKCLIVDCHSFPSTPFRFEENKSLERPDICLGTDGYHTPEEIFNLFRRSFIEKGYSIQENHPFAGTIVPIKYYHLNKNVYSIMIEANRKLFLDEGTGKKSRLFKTFGDNLEYILREIREYWCSEVLEHNT